MPSFHDRSPDEIDRIIEACVDGFQDAMRREALSTTKFHFRSHMQCMDLNHGSGFVYGQRTPRAPPVGERIDALVDQALLARARRHSRRAIISARRGIGEPCSAPALLTS